MNRSYTENTRFNSDFGIYEAFYAEVASAPSGAKKAAEKLLSMLACLLTFFTSATAFRVARVVAVTLCMVGTVGIVGAMETGRLSLLSGLGISALLLGVELLCLRGRKKTGK